MRRITLLVAALAGSLALAGCLSTAPALGTASQEDPDEGLVLQVKANRSTITPGETVAFDVVVENRGSEPVTYRDGCYSAWDVALEGPSGDEVQAHLRGTCDGFSLATLQPGEEVAYSWSAPEADYAWNGTRWDDDGWSDAEPGTYVLRAAFAYEDGNASLTASGSDQVEVEERDGGAPDDGDGSKASDGGSVEAQGSASRDEIQPGETVHANFTATNTGDETVEHRTGCGHAWDVTVTDESGAEVETHRPRGTCMGFSYEELAPDESVSEGWTWNGTVWNGSAYEEAEPGDYTVEASFPYRTADDETRTAAAEVTVTVTEDDG